MQAVVTNALARQRYQISISIFPLFCIDSKHAVPSCSSFLAAYSHSFGTPCHFSPSAPSFAPSIVPFPNRWGLKTPLSALFSTISTSCKWVGKRREEISVLVHAPVNIFNHAVTDKQTGTQTWWIFTYVHRQVLRYTEVFSNELECAHLGAGTQKYRQTGTDGMSAAFIDMVKKNQTQQDATGLWTKSN